MLIRKGIRQICSFTKVVAFPALLSSYDVKNKRYIPTTTDKGSSFHISMAFNLSLSSIPPSPEHR